jgi:hypothetical protein
LLALVIAYQIGVLQLLGAEGYAKLPAVHPTPDETLPISGHRSRVVGSTGQAHHSLAAEPWYLHREGQEHFIAAGQFGIAGFTEAVQTPSPHLVLLVNRQGVIVPAGDMLDVSDVDAVRGERVHGVTSRDMAT